MINITEYLEWIYRDFKIQNEQAYLCQLKGLTFESGCLPDYQNIQIQRLYLLRYAFAYGFEYTTIYAEALERLHKPDEVSVASIGCGTFIDYWSLVQAIERRQKIQCKVRYVGIDEIDWSYKFAKRMIDEIYFNQGNAKHFFASNAQFISDIYFFPKSISEFTAEEMNIMTENLKNKPIIKDKLILCFSLRADIANREADLKKTQQVIDAFKENGFEQKNLNYRFTYFPENRGIAAYDSQYVYPQQAYDYIKNLNQKCSKYIEQGANCKNSCSEYLNRSPILKTGTIFYQLIDLERKRSL